MQCGLDELNPSARSIQMDMNNRKNEVNIEKKKRSIAIEVGASHELSTAIALEVTYLQELHHKAIVHVSDLR